MPRANRPAPPPDTVGRGPRAGCGIRSGAGATAPPRLGWPIHGPAHPRRTPARPCGAEAPDPLREAGPAALLLHPRLRPRPGAGAAPGRRADGLLRRLPPAPADLLRQRRPHGHGQRGGVLRDPGHRAGRPGGGARGPRRGAARGARRASRSSRPRRARSPTGSRPASGRSWCAAPTRRARGCRRRATSPATSPRRPAPSRPGPRTFDTRGAVLALWRVTGSTRGCAILRVVARHTTPAVRPDDILTALRAVTGFSPPVPPLVTRLAQGPLLDATAGVADPLAADKDAAGSG